MIDFKLWATWCWYFTKQGYTDPDLLEFKIDDACGLIEDSTFEECFGEWEHFDTVDELMDDLNED